MTSDHGVQLELSVPTSGMKLELVPKYLWLLPNTYDSTPNTYDSTQLLLTYTVTWVAMVCLAVGQSTKCRFFLHYANGVLDFNCLTFRFTGSTIQYATGIPSASDSYFSLTRRYYVHKTYSKFHRIICDIKGIFYVEGRICCSVVTVEPLINGPSEEMTASCKGHFTGSQ